ncbi:MAG: hypothetical protein A2Y07_07090 [Planctomycetes bacterium GWF2_50_10]|nr:MAG: hypothetical protein A2Y07_07090 [Planctomycetes bacterium GWF2_50_10]
MIEYLFVIISVLIPLCVLAVLLDFTNRVNPAFTVACHFLKYKKFTPPSPAQIHPSRCGNPTVPTPQHPPDPPQISILVELVNDPEPAFSASFRGFQSQCQSVNLRLDISDTTEPNPSTHNVLCTDERLRHPITKAFTFDLAAGRLPDSQVFEWQELTKIPADFLLFARLGPRRLVFKLSVSDSATRNMLATAVFTMLYNNPNSGYIDLELAKTKARRLGVTLALTIASRFDSLTQTHIDTVLTWLGSRDPQTQKALAHAVKVIHRNPSANYKTLALQLLTLTDPQTRLDIIDLCLQLSPSSPPAIEALNSLAFTLKIDHPAYLTLLAQKLGNQVLSSPQLMLGIVPEMDCQTACRILNDEYRRWNSRVTSFDPSLRTRAKQMIDLITQARENTYQPA